jgi:hypothetical protein
VNRRSFLELFSALLAAGVLQPGFAFGSAIRYVSGHSDISNFKKIYEDKNLRNAFLTFLKNVYSIYPPDEFHRMIVEITKKNETDEKIYLALQKRLPELKSLLSPVTRELPALHHQKDEMAGQITKLLKDTKKADGYMEIGTTGRYIHSVKQAVGIKNKTYLLHTERPQFFSLTDIVERGQLRSIGKFIDMGPYKEIANEDVPNQSLDLITNFIGFHHAPVEQRDAFIASVSKKLRSGGRLLLRDHDVDSDSMRYIVALAHDVFNAGLNVSWDVNLNEIRNFTSVPQIEEALNNAGLIRVGDKLLQTGDPTQNTMMLFVKA